MTAGEHIIASRAVDASGKIQPAMPDPWIAGKKTYWESNTQLPRRFAFLEIEEVADW